MTERSAWWENFFEGLVVDFWRAAIPLETTRQEADFLEARLALFPGARVLDVPCGDGRLALELAARGHRVTGVDLSPEFVAAARESASGRGLSIEWRLSDMRDLPWSQEFDAAFCAGSSFGFLGDAEDARFLAAVARTLRPGALFAIDAVKAAEVIFPAFRERHELDLADIHFSAENRYDHESGWMENRYTIARGEKVESRRAWHRVYTYRELARMLEAAGFGEVEGLASWSGEPFRLGASRLTLLARKRR